MFKLFFLSLCHSTRSSLVSAAPTRLPLLFFSQSIALFLLCLSLFSRFLYLALSGAPFSSLPLLSGYNGSPVTHFFQKMTRPMSWPNGVRYSSHLLFGVVTILLPLVFTLFLDWRRTVSSKFFDTQAPSVSTKEIVLPRHACCILSRLRCKGYSFLFNSYLYSIGKIENPWCSAGGHPPQCTSHLILHCPATDSLRSSLFGDSFSVCDLWSRPWRVATLLLLHGLPPCPYLCEGLG